MLTGPHSPELQHRIHQRRHQPRLGLPETLQGNLEVDPVSLDIETMPHAFACDRVAHLRARTVIALGDHDHVFVTRIGCAPQGFSEDISVGDGAMLGGHPT